MEVVRVVLFCFKFCLFTVCLHTSHAELVCIYCGFCFVYIRLLFLCILTTFIRFCWFGLQVCVCGWVSGMMRLCVVVCVRLYWQIQRRNWTSKEKQIAITKQLTERNNRCIDLTLIRAYFEQQFTCCISSFCVWVSACVCVYWFGLLLLLFVLFLYWYIMEEFELPWAIVSFHYFLFYFVLRVAVCVCDGYVSVRLCLCMCVYSFTSN